MLQKLIYTINKVIIGAGLRIFFQEIQIRNKKQIPEEEPFIITANHPNDKLDAFIIGKAVSRKVNFLAAGFLFKYKLLSFFMKSMGTIPLYRRDENSDASERNIKSFAACFEVLENKGAIGIFPEGLTHLDRQVKKVKTGAARIAFEAEVRNNWKLGLKIIPVGLNYYYSKKIRSKVFVNIGKPINVADFREEYEKDPEEAIYKLTSLIHKKIQQHIVHIDSENVQQLLGYLEVIYKEHLIKQLSREKKTETIDEFVLSQKLAKAVQYFYEHNPAKIAEVWGRLENYQRKLDVMGVSDTMIREYRHRGIVWRGIGAFLITIIGVPIVLYGWINSLPAIILTLFFSQRKANRLTKIVLTKFLSSLIIFPTMYIIQIIIFSRFFDPEITLAYAVSLPITGYFTLFFRDKFRAYKRDMYQAYIHFTKRPLVYIMKKERLQLIRYLNKVKDEYLAAISNK